MKNASVPSQDHRLAVRRFAAVSVLFLSLPAAAQMQAGKSGETLSSPLGEFRRDWSAALGGAMLQPSGPLHLYAFPLSVSYNAAAAMAPDEEVLHRLAPFAVALERSSVSPEEFKRLSAEERTARVMAILPESNKLVIAYADGIMERVRVLKEDEKGDAIIGELKDVLKNYPGHFNEKAKDPFWFAYVHLESRRRRMMEHGAPVAKFLSAKGLTIAFN